MMKVKVGLYYEPDIYVIPDLISVSVPYSVRTLLLVCGNIPSYKLNNSRIVLLSET